MSGADDDSAQDEVKVFCKEDEAEDLEKQSSERNLSEEKTAIVNEADSQQEKQIRTTNAGAEFNNLPTVAEPRLVNGNKSESAFAVAHKPTDAIHASNGYIYFAHGYPGCFPYAHSGFGFLPGNVTPSFTQPPSPYGMMAPMAAAASLHASAAAAGPFASDLLPSPMPAHVRSSPVLNGTTGIRSPSYFPVQPFPVYSPEQQLATLNMHLLLQQQRLSSPLLFPGSPMSCLSPLQNQAAANQIASMMMTPSRDKNTSDVGAITTGSNHAAIGPNPLASIAQVKLPSNVSLLNMSATCHPAGSSGGNRLTQPRKEKKDKEHIKKPLNAFMLYMKEMRPTVMQEVGLKERQSAEINRILGRRWHSLSRDDQQKYYDQARQERAAHLQKYPGWTARDNYAIHKKKKKKKDKLQNSLEMKKCRARFGVDQQNKWCKHCRRKKKCLRFRESDQDSPPAQVSSTTADGMHALRMTADGVSVLVNGALGPGGVPANGVHRASMSDDAGSPSQVSSTTALMQPGSVATSASDSSSDSASTLGSPGGSSSYSSMLSPGSVGPSPSDLMASDSGVLLPGDAMQRVKTETSAADLLNACAVVQPLVQ